MSLDSIPQYLEHRTTPGERWDILAGQYYNDASKMHIIIDANAHLFHNAAYPAILPSGLVLRIPIIEAPAIANELLPPWKQK